MVVEEPELHLLVMMIIEVVTDMIEIMEEEEVTITMIEEIDMITETIEITETEDITITEITEIIDKDLALLTDQDLDTRRMIRKQVL